MIKRLLLATLLAISTSAFAAEKITIIWGFAPGANQGVFYRALASEANKSQDKYEFLFDSKTGAGGAVAARHVLANPKNTVLGATSTFFIRANFDKETGYNLDQFQPVVVQTLHAPLALFSTKYSKLSDLKTADDFTVSISGYGSHSNLLANSLSDTYTKLRIINYVSLFDANKDVYGKHIDTGWNWLSEIEQQAQGGFTNILAITGTKGVKDYKTLSSQKIKGFENLSTNSSVQASAEMPVDKVKEIHEILRQANRTLEVRQYYYREYSTPADMNWAETVKWFDQQGKFWAKEASKVKPLIQ
jgi:tripartite-type tricarboxylate transporter receptor subunit TctC